MKATLQVTISLALILLTFSTRIVAQENPNGTFDALANENIHKLVSKYIELNEKLFNTPYNDSLRISFNSIFAEDALIFRDYTTEKLSLSPEEYVYYLNNYFGENKPSVSFPADYTITDLKHIASGNYYVAKVRFNKQLSFLYNKNESKIESIDKNYLLQAEVLVYESARATKFLGIRDVSPAPPIETTTETVAMAEAKTKVVKEKIVQEKPIKEKQVKEKPVKEPTVKTPKDFDHLVMLNWTIGGNFSKSAIQSESANFTVAESSYSAWQLGLSTLLPLSKQLYVGIGAGFHFGSVNINYENTSYSFEFADNVNSNVESYTRNVFLTDTEENIRFTNLNLQGLFFADLLKSTKNKLLIGAGISVGIPLSEISDVTATTKYTGTFTTVDGQTFPEPFTLGEQSEVPVYGFTKNSFVKAFKLESSISLSIPIQLKAIHIFDNGVFLGAGIESHIPLSSWMQGDSNHERVFSTSNDLNTSLLSTVSASKRPLFIGFGVSIGVKF
jgi:hypothetical protein